ncbi:MAG TPA: alpha/beta hydrolase [Thermoanaerobaculia bacterium]|nr:alpha/beta hydrolase [Thermoanaerobaculia bacterium]
MLWKNKRRRILLTALAIAVAGVAGLVLFLRADKTQEFYNTRGTYRGARVIESSVGFVSRTRLVELQNDRGEAVATAYVRTPRRLVSPCRILLTYAGAKTGATILRLIPDRPDLVLVAVQYPFARPHTVGEYLMAPYRLRQAVFRSVAGGMLALSYLRETAGLQTRDITVLGASVGSSFAVIHGALDPRVRTVFLVHGGGGFPSSVRGMERRSGHALRGELLAGAAAVLVDSFEPGRYVERIAPRRLVMVSSRRDKYFAVAGVQALYDRAGEPKTLIWTDTEHVGARKTELVKELVRLIEDYLDGGGPIHQTSLPGTVRSPQPN